MSDTPSTPLEFGRRFAFERWCSTAGYSAVRMLPGSDVYNSRTTQELWLAWSAAWDCQQASIDRLMLEYCPDEMTPSQKAAWEANQKPGFDERFAEFSQLAAERGSGA